MIVSGTKKIIIILIMIMFNSYAFAENKIELFSNAFKNTEFYKGELYENAIEHGIVFVHYKIGKRKKIEKYLSDGIGSDSQEALKKVKSKLENKKLINELIKTAQGEQRVIQYNIKKLPAILIDGKIFYTNNIEQALEMFNEN